MLLHSVQMPGVVYPKPPDGISPLFVSPRPGTATSISSLGFSSFDPLRSVPLGSIGNDSLADDAIRAIHTTCIQHVQEASNRVLLKLERRLQPLLAVTRGLEKQIDRQRVWSLEVMGDQLTKLQTQLRDLEIILENTRERPRVKQTQLEAEIRQRLQATRSEVDVTCEGLQTQLRHLSGVAKNELERVRIDGTIAEIQLHVDEVEQATYGQFMELSVVAENQAAALRVEMDSVRDPTARIEARISNAETLASADRVAIKVSAERVAQRVDELQAELERAKEEWKENARRDSKDSSRINDLERDLCAAQGKLSEREEDAQFLAEKLNGLEAELQRPEHRTPSLLISRLRVWCRGSKPAVSKSEDDLDSV